MTIAELLKLNDESFVRAAYRTLLSREGDEAGVRSYAMALKNGLPKADILLEMNRSFEWRTIRTMSNGDLFNAIFDCGPEAFTGFPTGEGRLHRLLKRAFKRLLWTVCRHEIRHLYFSSILAYEALERIEIRSSRGCEVSSVSAEEGAGASSLPYGVWKTYRELDS